MTDDELAFVLCHELSHTIYGHTLKQTQNKAWLAGVQATTPPRTLPHHRTLCPCPHHPVTTHHTFADGPQSLFFSLCLSPKTSCLTRRIEFTTRHTNSCHVPVLLVQPRRGLTSTDRRSLCSVLDPTGLTSLLIEAGLGYALKYGGELPMSREAENEADGTKF